MLLPEHVAVLVAGSVLLSSPAQSELPPQALSPTGDWIANFADDSCSLSRTFGSGSDSVLLILRTYGPNAAIEAQVASRGTKLVPDRPSVRFLPAVSEVGGAEYFGELRGKNGWVGITLPVARPTVAAQVTGVELQRVFQKARVLTTGAMSGAFRVLDRCEDDLMTSLGLDAQAHRTMTQPVAVNWNDDWLNVTTPMQRRLINRGSMRQDVRVLVDELGKPYGCKVVAGAVDESIAQNLCDALLEHAHFQPALNVTRNPMKSYFILSLSATRSVHHG